jgi:hypothetical protein
VGPMLAFLRLQSTRADENLIKTQSPTCTPLNSKSTFFHDSSCMQLRYSELQVGVHIQHSLVMHFTLSGLVDSIWEDCCIIHRLLQLRKKA